jgi:hypothetical protein
MTMMEPLARQFRLLTDWHLSVLEGIQLADGRRPPDLERTQQQPGMAGRPLSGDALPQHYSLRGADAGAVLLGRLRGPNPAVARLSAL